MIIPLLLGRIYVASVRTRPNLKIKTVDELDQALASADGKVVMLDFYADWCVSCIEMEKLTFTEPAVKQAMNEMLLLQADVTANDADDKALLKRFSLFGPPGIIFFNPDGQEILQARVIGFKSADIFYSVCNKSRRNQQALNSQRLFR